MPRARNLLPQRPNTALAALRARLNERAEAKYRDFSSALLPNVGGVLGVRIPYLRGLAKQSAKNGRPEFAQPFSPQSFEERMVEGLSIAYSNLPQDKMFGLVAQFVPKIDNWSVCDSFCLTLKFIEKNREDAWRFVLPYFDSPEEFKARFARVIFLGYFVDSEHLDDGLRLCSALKNRERYAIMAAAWAIAECAAKFPERVFCFLKSLGDRELLRLSVRKIRESYRISPEYKKAFSGLL